MLRPPGHYPILELLGRGSALSRSWPSGINPLHDGTVPNPMGRTTPDAGGTDQDGRLTLAAMKLNSRWQLKIAKWNIRTINSPGKMEVLESELGRYSINVMGLAETKWKGKEVHYYTTEGNMVIHAENNVKECGVGFIVDRTSSKAVIGYESVSNRAMALRLASSPMNMTIIQCYAPTSQYDENDIEAF